MTNEQRALIIEVLNDALEVVRDTIGDVDPEEVAGLEEYMAKLGGARQVLKDEAGGIFVGRMEGECSLEMLGVHDVKFPMEVYDWQANDEDGGDITLQNMEELEDWANRTYYEWEIWGPDQSAVVAFEEDEDPLEGSAFVR